MNGGLDIQQRSGSMVGGNGFVTDRWYVGSSTPSDVNTATATFPGQEFARYVRIGNGIGARNVFKQPIELPAGYVGGKAGPFTQGSTWTFSFYHNPSSAAPADPAFAFSNNTGGANAVSTNLAAFTDVTGDTASGWQRKSVTFTISITPNAGNLCAIIQFTGDNTECTGFQLEPGPVATPFEQRPIALELSLCQRYYQKFQYSNDGSVLYFSQVSPTVRMISGMFPVQLRVAPTYFATLSAGTANAAEATTRTYFISTLQGPEVITSVYVDLFTADAEL
jgi:hypothetical protein